MFSIESILESHDIFYSLVVNLNVLFTLESAVPTGRPRLCRTDLENNYLESGISEKCFSNDTMAIAIGQTFTCCPEGRTIYLIFQDY